MPAESIHHFLELPSMKTNFGLAAIVIFIVSCATASAAAPLVPSLVRSTARTDAAKSATGTFVSLYSFRYQPGFSNDAAIPVGGLVYVNGEFYGAAGGGPGMYLYGPGTIFEVSPTGQEKVLFDFGTQPHDSYAPSSGLTLANGVLYGTTAGGGNFANCGGGCGTVFGFTPSSGNSLHTIYDFNGPFSSTSPVDGASPGRGLVAVNGKLFGTTQYGGLRTGGTVFEISQPGADTILHDFTNSPDGYEPAAGLTYVNGVLYGTTPSGGANGTGTIYSITSTGERVVYSFRANASGVGAVPEGTLLYLNGEFYGTTYLGGNSGGQVGTIFEINATTRAEKVLRTFVPRTSDGNYPDAGLVALNGLLYGTTRSGGASNLGTMFQIAPDGSNYKVLHSFNLTDGAYPEASMIAVNGVLYGTTTQGGNDASCGYSLRCGTVFKYTPVY
jgi:uncharacterized repeat protein (TIGR03803 family)